MNGNLISSNETNAMQITYKSIYGFPSQEKIRDNKDIQSQCYSTNFNRDRIPLGESPDIAIFSKGKNVTDVYYGPSIITLRGSPKTTWTIRSRDYKNIKRFEFPILTSKYSEKEDIKDNNEMMFFTPHEIHKHIRKRNFTLKDKKKARSIIGIVKEGLKEDSSRNFRDYLYKE